VICAPKTLIPPKAESWGIEVTTDLKKAIKDADVINLLRIQMERQSESFFPSIREYARSYQINQKVLELAKKEVMIMHPGPVNRGVELASDVMDGPYSVILDQVTNGLAVRMAVLYLLSGVRKKGRQTNGSHL